MQRLVLAVLLLALLIALLSVAAAGVRASLGPGGRLRDDGGALLQKLAYVALFLLIFGVSTGWLGGL